MLDLAVFLVVSITRVGFLRRWIYFIYSYFGDKIFYLETKRFDGVCFCFKESFVLRAVEEIELGLGGMRPV